MIRLVIHRDAQLLAIIGIGQLASSALAIAVYTALDGLPALLVAAMLIHMSSLGAGITMAATSLGNDYDGGYPFMVAGVGRRGYATRRIIATVLETAILVLLGSAPLMVIGLAPLVATYVASIMVGSAFGLAVAAFSPRRGAQLGLYIWVVLTVAYYAAMALAMSRGLISLASLMLVANPATAAAVIGVVLGAWDLVSSAGASMGLVIPVTGLFASLLTWVALLSLLAYALLTRLEYS